MPGPLGISSTVRVHTGPPVPLLDPLAHDLDQPSIGNPWIGPRSPASAQSPDAGTPTCCNPTTGCGSDRVIGSLVTVSGIEAPPLAPQESV